MSKFRRARIASGAASGRRGANGPMPRDTHQLAGAVVPDEAVEPFHAEASPGLLRILAFTTVGAARFLLLTFSITAGTVFFGLLCLFFFTVAAGNDPMLTDMFIWLLWSGLTALVGICLQSLATALSI